MMSFDKNNPLHIYMREIGRIKPLTKSEDDQLDLIQKGNDGLQQALSTFSGNSQGSFSGYAAICIEAAIAKAALESGSR